MISEDDYGKSKQRVIYEMYLKTGKRVSIRLPKDNHPKVAYFGPRQISPERVKAIFKEDDYCCIYCGKKTVKPICEHITPVNLGGTSSYCNLATACFECNNSKGSKDCHEWMLANNLTKEL